MSSNDRSDHLDLDRGLPTSAEDVAALRRLHRPRMGDDDYVRMLLDLQPTDSSVLARKRGPRGEPFRLKGE